METARTLARFYPRLGFDPDYLMYRSTIFPFLEKERDMPLKDLAAFCRTSFLSAIVSEPSSYARKVFTQLGYFFFPDEGTFFRTRIRNGEALRIRSHDRARIAERGHRPTCSGNVC